MSLNVNEIAREDKPTCPIVDPARRFGGKTDRLFSDLAARAFWHAGWNVVWWLTVMTRSTIAPTPMFDALFLQPLLWLKPERPPDDEPLPLEARGVPGCASANGARMAFQCSRS